MENTVIRELANVGKRLRTTGRNHTRTPKGVLPITSHSVYAARVGPHDSIANLNRHGLGREREVTKDHIRGQSRGAIVTHVQHREAYETKTEPLLALIRKIYSGYFFHVQFNGLCPCASGTLLLFPK